MTRAGLVVPCFDEARRFDASLVASLVADPRVSVVLVDDGSRDRTRALLGEAAAASPRVDVVALPENRGKAEAVRVGLLHALARGSDVVGYADADFATPPAELLRLLDVLLSGDAAAVLGSRLARLGAVIERRPGRHLVGRGFATVASYALGFPVYDTQCGAKWFRATPGLRAALSAPFVSGWAFDVELLLRLTGRASPCAEPVSPERLVEVPLEVWRDVGGSKVGALGGAGAFVAAARLWWGRRRRG